jgi:hypothetical protein
MNKLVNRLAPTFLATSLLTGCISDDVETDCIFNLTTDKTFQPYIKTLTENPKIMAAMDLCDLPEQVQDTLWEKIATSESIGSSPDGPLPSSYFSLQNDEKSLDITTEEAYQIYAAHLAHSLWVDNNNLVPWKLSDYSQEDLERLLKPTSTFYEFDIEREQFQFSYHVNHSPNITFLIAREMVNINELTDQASSLNEILKTLRTFRHGANHSRGGELICSDYKGILRMDEMDQERVSRSGCHSMANYFTQIANSLNIPGKMIKGFYNGGGHRTAAFEFTNQILSHGDDVYNAYLDNTPSEKLMTSFQYWNDNVLSLPRGNREGAHNSLVPNKNNAFNFLSYGMTWDYCKNYKQRFDDYFSGFKSEQELNVLEQEILLKTENCTVFPENSPDGTGDYKTKNPDCTRAEENLNIQLVVEPYDCSML